MRLVLHPIGVIPGIHGIQQEVSTMIQRRRLGLATCLTLAVGLLLAGPTAAASNHGLHLTVTSFEFGSFDCVDIVCTGRADGFATSNLAGDGTIQWELVTTFFDGFDSNCNHVDEIGRFTFGDDSMTLVSPYRLSPPGAEGEDDVRHRRRYGPVRRRDGGRPRDRRSGAIHLQRRHPVLTGAPNP
jgi:hypothetical protein